MINPFAKLADRLIGTNLKYTATYQHMYTGRKFTFSFRCRHGIVTARHRADGLVKLAIKRAGVNLDADKYEFWTMEIGE